MTKPNSAHSLNKMSSYLSLGLKANYGKYHSKTGNHAIHGADTKS